MLLIIVVIFIIPRHIFPIARDRRRDPFVWSGVAGVVFVFVGLASLVLGGLLFGLFVARTAPSYAFVLRDHASYAAFLVGGLIAVGFLGRWIGKLPLKLDENVIGQTPVD